MSRLSTLARLDLGAGVERLVDDLAGQDGLELGAHEGGALAGLDVLELHDGPELALDVEDHAVLQVVGRSHAEVTFVVRADRPAPSARGPARGGVQRIAVHGSRRWPPAPNAAAGAGPRRTARGEPYDGGLEPARPAGGPGGARVDRPREHRGCAGAQSGRAGAWRRSPRCRAQASAAATGSGPMPATLAAAAGRAARSGVVEEGVTGRRVLLDVVLDPRASQRRLQRAPRRPLSPRSLAP